MPLAWTERLGTRDLPAAGDSIRGGRVQRSSRGSKGTARPLRGTYEAVPAHAPRGVRSGRRGWLPGAVSARSEWTGARRRDAPLTGYLRSCAAGVCLTRLSGSAGARDVPHPAACVKRFALRLAAALRVTHPAVRGTSAGVGAAPLGPRPGGRRHASGRGRRRAAWRRRPPGRGARAPRHSAGRRLPGRTHGSCGWGRAGTAAAAGGR